MLIWFNSDINMLHSESGLCRLRYNFLLQRKVRTVNVHEHQGVARIDCDQLRRATEFSHERSDKIYLV